VCVCMCVCLCARARLLKGHNLQRTISWVTARLEFITLLAMGHAILQADLAFVLF